MAGVKGSSCKVPGCDGTVMSDERGVDILPCECDFKICRECFMDAVKTGDRICLGCKEPYKQTDLDNSVDPQKPLSLPSNVQKSQLERRMSSKMERRLSLMKSTNKSALVRSQTGDFNHNRWLFKTQETYGYGNALWPKDKDSSDDNRTGILDQLPKLAPVNHATVLDVLKEMFKTPSPQNPFGKLDHSGVDVFVSTADPEKEPTLVTTNTILPILAADYPVDKLSCYVSNDSGSWVELW
nr:cellulose synthase-like protein D3 [Tanacetum cinerariifolium]